MGFFTDGLRNFLSGLGTAKDKSTHSEFFLRPITAPELHSMYRSSWLPRKIVDIIPHDMTREWRNWQAEEDQIEKIEAEEERLGVLQKVDEALKLGRLLGGGCIYLGTRDNDLRQPLRPESIGEGSLNYLHVLSREEITFTEIERDVRSPFFRQPKFFQLRSTDLNVDVHPSRMVIFPGEAVLDRTVSDHLFWGDSVLQIVYDAVMNAISSQSGTASLMHEAKVDVMYIPGLGEELNSPGGEARLNKRFTYANQAKSMFNMLLLDGTGKQGGEGTGEYWDQKTIQFGQFPELLNLFLQVCAAAADIPVTRLLGDSPSGLNATGESDIRNHYDNIAARQRIFLKPALRPLDEILLRSALGSRPKEIYYEWAPLWQMTEQEKADLQEKKATTTQKYLSMGVIPEDAFAKVIANQLVEDGVYPGLQGAIEDSPKEPGDDLTEKKSLELEAAAKTNAQIGKGPSFRDMDPRPLYVRRDVKNAREIINWARSQGLTNLEPASELHVTILYSRTAVDWLDMGSAWQEEIVIPAGGPRVVEQFGDVMVLSIVSDELRWRHEGMVNKGASHDFPKYQPHITFSRSLYVQPDTIEPYQGQIVLGPEIFEDIKENR